MKKTFLITSIWVFIALFFSEPIGADIYKYIDQDGNTLFTDDLSKIPRDERKNVERRFETRSNSTNSEIFKTNSLKAKKELSLSDIEFINALKEKGFDIQDKDISSEYVNFIRILLEREHGIKDISNWYPNSNFSSPETTWHLHKEAMQEGKIEDALECFVYKSKTNYRKIFQAVGPDGISKIAREMNSLQRITGDESYAKYRLIRNESVKRKIIPITYYVYFQKFLGEWKIEKY